MYTCIYIYVHTYTCKLKCIHSCERWGAGVQNQKNVRGEIGGWGRVPFNGDSICTRVYTYMYIRIHVNLNVYIAARGGGLGSRPKKMYGERLGDGVEYHSMETRCERVYTYMYIRIYVNLNVYIAACSYERWGAGVETHFQEIS